MNERKIDPDPRRSFVILPQSVGRSVAVCLSVDRRKIPIVMFPAPPPPPKSIDFICAKTAAAARLLFTCVTGGRTTLASVLDWMVANEIVSRRHFLVQGCAKKFLLSLVRRVPLRLMGCALAA